LQGVSHPYPLLAVYGPPQVEKNTEFRDVAEYLSAVGIPVPHILSWDFEQGFMVLEDLGCDSLYDVLDAPNAGKFYSQAMVDLHCLSAAQRPAFIEPYNAQKLQVEMALFTQWFVPELLGHALADEEQAMLDSLFESLVNSAAEQPAVCVLRDFHSRNIMVRADASLAYIDFQDALWGPCTYDLVSMLKDCYIRWPDQQVDRWCRQYFDLLRATITADIRYDVFKCWFDLMGLQRHIKVLGIFSRLALRDGKKSYLKDLPLVIRYTLEAAEQYPQTQRFAEWFKQTLLPLAVQQDWYQPYLLAGDDGCNSGDEVL
jgi:aminoglycoside/choline kinase family phosphotransferase